MRKTEELLNICLFIIIVVVLFNINFPSDEEIETRWNNGQKKQMITNEK